MDVIHVPGAKREDQDKKEAKKETIVLQNIPQSVNDAFALLPQPIQDAIRSALNEENEHPFFKDDTVRKTTLEAMFLSLEKWEREHATLDFIRRLFMLCNTNVNFKNKLIENPIELRRVIELLWYNRSAPPGHQRSYNEEYYREYYVKRKAILDEIEKKEAEIYLQKGSIEKTKSQRRLTETKEVQLEELRQELRLINKKLDAFDSENNNFRMNAASFTRDEVKKRELKENEIINNLCIALQYLDATEFAVVMGEAIDDLFYRENEMAENKTKWTLRYPSEDQKQRARAVLNSLRMVIEKWSTEYENDPRMKIEDDLQKAAVKETKNQKVIDYFVSLVVSYRDDSKDGATEDTLRYTVRQMETSLNLLKR